jgi:ribosomal-protein-alanine N-acetyltransferase
MRHFRISDQNPIKTKRLLLTPLTASELAVLEAQEQNELLRGAIAEMRRNVAAFPAQALWHTGWRVSRRQDGEAVGLLGFHGVQQQATVELGYDIFSQHRGNGYCAEAVRALCDWAFGCEGVYFISALVDEANGVSNHVLDKLKFYRVESPVDGLNGWELERPASAWLAVYMSIGLAIGISFGQTLFDNMATGLAIGLGAGIALGSGLDAQDRAARKRENAPKKIVPDTNEKPGS